jgi:hypothetical protein
MRVLVAVLFLGCAAAQSPTPWTGTRDSRNLECNSTADGAVLLNGQDVVSRSHRMHFVRNDHTPTRFLSLPRPDGDQVQKGVGVSHLKQHAYVSNACERRGTKRDMNRMMA